MGASLWGYGMTDAAALRVDTLAFNRARDGSNSPSTSPIRRALWMYPTSVVDTTLSERAREGAYKIPARSSSNAALLSRLLCVTVVMFSGNQSQFGDSSASATSPF
jgi:hypothetical protein